ncbi:hypothetical protein FOPG_18952 [Fusarium oxysporum f. sp. conglutinans race 2 54008]|uniref:Uncharacterized protein n=1 Tax=Fusarium oxysporum f. sp. conglutinans race 2 54008 TaxID=1089457 RepID=X0HUI5_FUSOX|nr:hypothetical protein FOPG_18952 [Fusarium oxysporum f. sp. conglutinans race 2 54008]
MNSQFLKSSVFARLMHLKCTVKEITVHEGIRICTSMWRRLCYGVVES